MNSVAHTVFVLLIFYRTKQSLKTNDTLLDFSTFPAYATEEDILRFISTNF